MMRRLSAWVMVAVLLLVAACTPTTPAPRETPPASALGRILQRGELILGTAGSMPPFNMTTRDGKVIGLDIDLARYIAHGMGVTLRIETMPFARLLPALEEGKVDLVLSSMTITPKRNLKVAFVGPYFLSGKALLTKKKQLATLKDPAQLNSAARRFAVLDASTSLHFVQQRLPASTVVKAQDYDQAIRWVIDGKVDAMIADFPVCVIAVARHPKAGLTAGINTLSYEPLGIALPASDPHLLNWMDNFLSTMAASGELAQLKKRWFKHLDWLQQLP